MAAGPNQSRRRHTMGDEAKGKADHVGGKIKEKAGEVLGDRKLEQEGRLDQAKGRAEQDEARAEEKAERARREKREAEIRKERLDSDLS
jgi:uncharacterized protein YjbJ (UPF0337 family)